MEINFQKLVGDRILRVYSLNLLEESSKLVIDDMIFLDVERIGLVAISNDYNKITLRRIESFEGLILANGSKLNKEDRVELKVEPIRKQEEILFVENFYLAASNYWIATRFLGKNKVFLFALVYGFDEINSVDEQTLNNMILDGDLTIR
ncbi:MAG: hypothetical protein HYZ14_16150 [Bacteroidetes bacterium]|nr:hypothetical protein [Bacteroidota bacterium]